MNAMAITTLTSEINTPIIKHDTLLGKYCSYKAFYGAVINALENDDVSIDYINERHYFRALEKLNILIRGNLSTKEGDCNITPNRMGQLYPPSNIIQEVFENEKSGIYRMKRGTFGFNCKDDENMATKVLNPVVELLTSISAEMEEAIEKINDNKQAIKALGMNVSDAKKVTCDRVINKYL